MLRKVCQKARILPKSFNLPRDSTTIYHRDQRRPAAVGGSADIWRGGYRGRAVALKVIRVCDEAGSERTGDLFCEAVIWKHLRHRNITPFYGIDTQHYPLSFVSKWMLHGTITEYFKQNHGVDVSDVVDGLKYLHDLGIVHGDLKGSNVLVDEELVACLSDFGLAALIVGGSVRYMAPEIMDSEEFGLDRAVLSPQTDVYSLGMTIWEMFAGCPPFNVLPRDPVVIRRVLQGVRPERSQGADLLGLSDEVWELIEQCWCTEWSKRPSMESI
ncbi:hypothetical protein CERSUDRAFT_144863, partial [Gelatoporia subvermispora B]